jgi:phage terminase large subunit-like protein
MRCGRGPVDSKRAKRGGAFKLLKNLPLSPKEAEALNMSQMEAYFQLPIEEQRRREKAMDEDESHSLAHHWAAWERPDQRPPTGEWSVWLTMAGRGFGKTRMGAEWVRARAMEKADRRIAIIGATASDVRAVMVEGGSGLLSIAPEGEYPTYEPSLKRLIWPNGSIAELYSAAEPDGLRGGEHHFAWADEIGKWTDGVKAWDNMIFALRAGISPQVVATTTPRAVPLIQRLVREDGVVRTGGQTSANARNLAAPYLRSITKLYSGTRLGRQELDGELIESIEGALWQRRWIEAGRVAVAPPLVRVVVGVDPPASADGDACGIVAVGLGADNRYYVLGDHSVSGCSPAGWAAAVAEAVATWGADKVVAEANNGGDMVIATLQGADFAMPVRKVHASHGKVTRAEPVSLLYESGRVSHVGAMRALEDELCGFVVGGGYEGPGRSPDRADACVWAVTELTRGKGRGEPRVRGL